MTLLSTLPQPPHSPSQTVDLVKRVTCSSPAINPFHFITIFHLSSLFFYPDCWFQRCFDSSSHLLSFDHSAFSLILVLQYLLWLPIRRRVVLQPGCLFSSFRFRGLSVLPIPFFISEALYLLLMTSFHLHPSESFVLTILQSHPFVIFIIFSPLFDFKHLSLFIYCIYTCLTTSICYTAHGN